MGSRTRFIIVGGSSKSQTLCHITQLQLSIKFTVGFLHLQIQVYSIYYPVDVNITQHVFYEYY